MGKGIGQRRHKRIKVVLPVRICGKDAANNSVNELVHTLDITPNGARLGAFECGSLHRRGPLFGSVQTLSHFRFG